MGCEGSNMSVSEKNNLINVASLNYSSHHISPFEFYSTDYQIEEMALDKIIR